MHSDELQISVPVEWLRSVMLKDGYWYAAVPGSNQQIGEKSLTVEFQGEGWFEVKWSDVIGISPIPMATKRETDDPVGSPKPGWAAYKTAPLGIRIHDPERSSAAAPPVVNVYAGTGTSRKTITFSNGKTATIEEVRESPDAPEEAVTARKGKVGFAP